MATDMDRHEPKLNCAQRWLNMRRKRTPFRAGRARKQETRQARAGALKSTPNRPRIEPDSPPSRPQLDPKPTPHRPQNDPNIDPKQHTTYPPASPIKVANRIH